MFAAFGREPQSPSGQNAAANIFSIEDVRSIHELYPPPVALDGSGPPLVVGSSGQGLVTSQHLQANFETRVKTETQRLLISSFANDLDVHPEAVLELTKTRPHLALLSSNANEIIPKFELDTIHENLTSSLSNGLLSKQDFAAENDLHPDSLEALLRVYDEKLIELDDHVCSTTYDDRLSTATKDSILGVVRDRSNIDITQKDAKDLPGSPPLWLILRHLKQHAQSQDFAEEVFIRETPTYIRCQSKKLKGDSVKAWAHGLLTGEQSHLDLREPLTKGSEIYESIDDLRNEFVSLQDVEVVGSYAMPEKWFIAFRDSIMQQLQHEGLINVTQKLSQEFPEALHSHVTRKVEQLLLAAIQQRPGCDIRYISGFMVTGDRYDSDRNALLNFSKQNATSQWQHLQSSPAADIRFSLPAIFATIPPTQPFLPVLANAKPTEKAIEEAFNIMLLTHESANESAFAAFLTDRALSRLHMHMLALHTISDTTQHTQLSALLATHAQTDLLPDTLLKARSQGLVLSRKSRKNVQKFESALYAATGTPELSSILSIIDKFGKKQGIDTSTFQTSSSEQTKQTMMVDLRRRLQKAPKAGDNPVVFLTLVILLHAKFYEGVVYATGKYAPKIMKLLREKLGGEAYAELERWKDAAKLGSLTKEDREGIVKMAGM